MSKLLLFCAGFFCCTANYAQRITYQDLKYVLYHNVDQSGDYLLKKGFSFDSIDTPATDKKSVTYLYTKNQPNTTTYMVVRKRALNDVFFGVSASTYNQYDYLKFKQSLKLLGFKFKSTITNEGRLVTEYENGNLLVQFVLSKEADSQNTLYFITLERLDLEMKASLN